MFEIKGFSCGRLAVAPTRAAAVRVALAYLEQWREGSDRIVSYTRSHDGSTRYVVQSHGQDTDASCIVRPV